METVPDVLTVSEVAAFMRVSRETVYRLAARGELPGCKIGRIWRFTRAAMKNYLSQDAGAASLLHSSGHGSSSHEVARSENKSLAPRSNQHLGVGWEDELR